MRRVGIGMAVVGIAVLAAVAAGTGYAVHRARLAERLVATPAEAVPGDPQLTRLAHEIAVPVFAANCARCHGPDMTGSPALGAPNLTDRTWLYDQGQVSDIERTILYGVRSGHPKSRNITDMPAVGRLNILKPDEIRDVVEYVEQLAHQPADAAASERGKALFKDRGNCFDCHAADGTGNPDYGSTDLTANVWTYGGDRETLFRSIRDGRHGRMDAFIGKLSAVQIRALAVEVYQRSHPPRTVAATPGVAAGFGRAGG
jgi:cytochrome c oxidase cbb3-type subunit 3